MTNRTNTTRARTRLTGESPSRAWQEFRRHGVLPRARGQVAHIEFLLLSHLGRGQLAAAVDWPTDTVMGIRSITPRADTSIIDIDPAVAGAMLETVLPRAVHDPQAHVFTPGLEPAAPRDTPAGDHHPLDGQTPPPTFRTIIGAAGVRAEPGRHGLILRYGASPRSRKHDTDPKIPGGAADAVVLRGLTDHDWRRIQEEILSGYASHEVPLWRDYPETWTRGEGRREQRQHHDCLSSTHIGSSLLRRLGLLRGKQVRCLEPDFAYAEQGPVFDRPGWPERRPGRMAVRIQPSTAPDDPGVLLWLDAAITPDDVRHWVIPRPPNCGGTAEALDRAPLGGATDAQKAVPVTTWPASRSTPRSSNNSTAEPGQHNACVNKPVAVEVDGALRVLVFPDHQVGGQCTAATTRHRRCRNVAWEHGQITGWVDFSVAGRHGSAYGPLTGEVRQRYLTQRCRLHPDSPAFCSPEWELLSSERHGFMLAPVQA